jgi:hypothetical protein
MRSRPCQLNGSRQHLRPDRYYAPGRRHAGPTCFPKNIGKNSAFRAKMKNLNIEIKSVYLVWLRP